MKLLDRLHALAAPLGLIAALACLMLAAPTLAAPGDQRVPPLRPGQNADDKSRMRTTSLPARDLFQGDQLSAAAKNKLSQLIVDALGLDVEVALVVPVGPWQLVPGGPDENQLSPARLQSVRKFLVERGVEPRRIFIESRIDPKLKEARLDFQMVGRPRTD